MTNGCRPVAPVPRRFISSPVGSRRSRPARHSRRSSSCDRALQPDRDVADPAGASDRREETAIADFAIRLAKKMRHRIRRPQSLDRRIGHDLQLVGHERHGQRHVESVGDAEGDERRELVDGGLDRIDGGHHVLSAAEKRCVVVGEDRRHRPQVQPFCRVKRESLGRETERHAPRADCLGAFGSGWARSFGSFAETLRGWDRTRR